MVSAYEFKFYFMTFYMISNEMMLDLYMLNSRMMNQVLIETNGTSIVTMNGDSI